MQIFNLQSVCYIELSGIDFGLYEVTVMFKIYVADIAYPTLVVFIQQYIFLKWTMLMNVIEDDNMDTTRIEAFSA